MQELIKKPLEIVSLYEKKASGHHTSDESRSLRAATYSWQGYKGEPIEPDRLRKLFSDAAANLTDDVDEKDHVNILWNRLTVAVRTHLVPLAQGMADRRSCVDHQAGTGLEIPFQAIAHDLTIYRVISQVIWVRK